MRSVTSVSAAWRKAGDTRCTATRDLECVLDLRVLCAAVVWTGVAVA